MAVPARKRKASAALGEQQDKLLPDGAGVSSDGEPSSRVVYVGHLPHGFFEQELLGFFSQFGKVTRVRASRNKKTAKSKGYAFLEFQHPEVAKIAADTMNGYFMFAQKLQCHLLKPEDVHPLLFKGANRVFKKIPWQKIERERLEKDRTPEQHARRIAKLVSRDNKRQKRIQRAGIDYTYDPLSTIAQQAPAPALTPAQPTTAAGKTALAVTPSNKHDAAATQLTPPLVTSQPKTGSKRQSPGEPAVERPAKAVKGTTTASPAAATPAVQTPAAGNKSARKAADASKIPAVMKTPAAAGAPTGNGVAPTAGKASATPATGKAGSNSAGTPAGHKAGSKVAASTPAGGKGASTEAVNKAEGKAIAGTPASTKAASAAAGGATPTAGKRKPTGAAGKATPSSAAVQSAVAHATTPAAGKHTATPAAGKGARAVAGTPVLTGKAASDAATSKGVAKAAGDHLASTPAAKKPAKRAQEQQPPASAPAKGSAKVAGNTAPALTPKPKKARTQANL